jgi:hypothetical protein
MMMQLTPLKRWSSHQGPDDEAVNTSETSVNFYEIAWRNIPEDSHP